MQVARREWIENQPKLDVKKLVFLDETGVCMIKRVRRSAEDWRGIIEQFEESGLTQIAFAKEHGLRASRRFLGRRPKFPLSLE